MTGKVKEWLKGVVVEMEKDLGTGTGQLKLRKAYDRFIAQFPKFAVIVPFPIFEYWVDQALKWMEKQLSSNTKVYDYVEGK